MNDVHNQLVTATRDCKVKIWDIRTMRSIQTIVDNTLQWLTDVKFDIRRLCLVLGGSLGCITPSQLQLTLCCCVCSGSHLRAWRLREMTGNTTTPSQQVYASARRADFDHSRVSVSRTSVEARSKKLPAYLRAVVRWRCDATTQAMQHNWVVMHHACCACVKRCCLQHRPMLECRAALSGRLLPHLCVDCMPGCGSCAALSTTHSLHCCTVTLHGLTHCC